MIGSQLLRYQNNQRFCLNDWETEGLNLRSSRPWQISYAICTNKHIDKVVTRYPLFKDINVSDEAARITRFDKKHYLSVGEDPAVVLKDFEEVALDPGVISLGHNLLGFDIYVWKILRRLCGKPDDWSFLPPIVDTLCLSRAYRRMMQPDLANFEAWQYKMLDLSAKIKRPERQKSSDPMADLILSLHEQHLAKQKGTGCSLGAMAREFDIPYDERYAHDSEYDTLCNHEVFKQLIWNVEV